MVKQKRVALLGAVLFLLSALVLPLGAQAASVEYHSIDISIQLEQDGGAWVTEVWDLTANEGTEVYMERIGLDEQEICSLSVTEDGYSFENIGEWDVNADFDEKAYKCGLVTRNDGYEICWGLGSYGSHVFTVEYYMSNFIKEYQDAGVIYQGLVTNIGQSVGSINVRIYSPNNTFTVENTGVWASGGATGEIWVQNGEVVAYTTETYQPGQSFRVLIQFADGMFSPQVYRDRSFEDLYQEAMEGSGYHQEDGSDFDYEEYLAQQRREEIWKMVLLVGALAFFGAVLALALTSSAKTHRLRGLVMKPEYRNPPTYSRELPYGGNLAATYTRLDELGQLENDCAIIGAYLLKWIRSRQVELTSAQGGLFGNKEETAIKLYSARPDMEPQERKLYDMLVKAAGPDFVLQSKEFEKWSRNKYETVQGWLQGYKNQGLSLMRQWGAIAQEKVPAFGGLMHTTKTVLTPYGEQMTVGMFGFRKYLQDFTIINEREAREVQLWDQYLVFAQLFGIADKVAEQFKQLYPAYFTQMATDLGYGSRIDMFDIYLITRLANSYGQAARTGYRAGYSAAHSSSSSGGGGGSFSGGGGGFSGSSGGGGSSGVR